MPREKTVQLPDFTGARCEALVLCGQLKVDPAVRLEDFHKEESRVYGEYKKLGKTIRVVVVRDRKPGASVAHFHVDFMTPASWQAWGKKHPLGVDTTKQCLNKSELINLMTPLVGYDYDAELTAFFHANRDELPSVIHYAMTPVQADGVELEMTGGRLSVRGAPVNVIRWNTTGKSNSIAIMMESRIAGRFDSVYLGEALKLVETAFGVLFHGDRDDS